MELIVMIIATFPIGFFVRNRLAAFVAYTALHAFVFTFQTLMLTIQWIGSSKSAFGPYPDATTSEVWAYLVVNTVIYAVGLGLVYLGGRVADGRRAKAVGGVHLDPVAG